MVLLSAIRRALLLRDILRHMVLIMLRTSHVLLILGLCICLSPLLPVLGGHVKNAFLHGNLDKVYIEQPPRMLLRGRRVRFATFVRLFMALGSGSLVMQFSGLVCIDVNLIIQFFSI